MAAARIQDLLPERPIPGLYERAADPQPSAQLRLDTTAFLGLCARGTPNVAVAVESWGAFVKHFGPPGGGRQLPEAVLHFFLNGGRRAVIVRTPEEGGNPTRAQILGGLERLGPEAETEPIALVCAPDLIHLEGPEPTAPPPEQPQSVEDLRFQTSCQPTVLDSTELMETRWPALSRPASAAELLPLLKQLVEFAETGRRLALIDLPPNLDSQGVETLSAGLASERAALYAPWLMASPAEDPTAPARPFPPSGAVAGRIAWTEAQYGPGRAPANRTLEGARSLYRDPYLPAPGELFDQGVNLIRDTPQGTTLIGARTLSPDAQWRAIGTRRLFDWLGGQLALDCRWAIFEPAEPRLWRRLELCVRRRLRTLFQANALAGPVEASSYFVRCDAETQRHQPEGAIVVLVGVAPAAPAQFIVFQLQLMRDGTVEVRDV